MRTEVAPRAPALGSALLEGAVAGVVAGVVMALFTMLAAASHGMSFWAPLKMIGATFVGADAMKGGPAIVLYGAILHLLVSAGLGAVFAALVPRDFPLSSQLMLGMTYAVVIGVVMTFVVPAVNPVFMDGIQPIAGAWIIAHALFGFALGLVPVTFRRRAERRHRREVRAPAESRRVDRPFASPGAARPRTT